MLRALELKQTGDFYIIIKYVACIRKLALQLNDEITVNLLGMELFNEIAGCFHCSSCC